jgi:hypothetical protein
MLTSTVVAISAFLVFCLFRRLNFAKFPNSFFHNSGVVSVPAEDAPITSWSKQEGSGQGCRYVLCFQGRETQYTSAFAI